MTGDPIYGSGKCGGYLYRHRRIDLQLTASGMQLTATPVDILSEICYVRIIGNRK